MLVTDAEKEKLLEKSSILNIFCNTIDFGFFSLRPAK